jgi:chaperonin cofactor prefoldin
MLVITIILIIVLALNLVGDIVYTFTKNKHTKVIEARCELIEKQNSILFDDLQMTTKIVKELSDLMQKTVNEPAAGQEELS